MKPAGIAIVTAFCAFSLGLHAQRLSIPGIWANPGAAMGEAAEPAGGAGGGGGGQSIYDAERDNPFSRLTFGGTVGTLGVGAAAATNLGPRADLRLFGNYTNLTHNFTQSGFRVALNIGMANVGGKVDLYPLRRFPLRISPGYLFFNGNRLAARLHAQPGATFTINNVEYASSTTQPVYGTGRLTLGGSGFMATAGLGHFLSHTYRRLTFPFEAGVVFIPTPVAQFNLYGQVCSQDANAFCQPASQFPEFSANLAAQVRSWNHTVAPYHIYPIMQGGVSYTFGWHHRGYGGILDRP
jgi:hypothetical protein